MLRPGYSPPNRQRVGDQLLKEIYESMQSNCKDIPPDQNVSMMLDGWNNVHNEPIVCVSVAIPDGQSYLTETVDTPGHGHTADYLQEVAESAVVSTERRFGCNVGSFVTHNAPNMVKMHPTAS